ncbi:hypothetical protein MKW92_008050 [Papaver armeniacum]|nr:hypothetical protein MKW92_008050 [Papaver armeniacum]
MAWRSAGSLSRSLLSTARASSVRYSPTLPRLRPSQLHTSPPRTRQLGCTQSIRPPVAACHLSPHLSLNAREMEKMADTGHQMLQQRMHPVFTLCLLFFVASQVLSIQQLYRITAGMTNIAHGVSSDVSINELVDLLS